MAETIIERPASISVASLAAILDIPAGPGQMGRLIHRAPSLQRLGLLTPSTLVPSSLAVDVLNDHLRRLEENR